MTTYGGYIPADELVALVTELGRVTSQDVIDRFGYNQSVSQKALQNAAIDGVIGRICRGTYCPVDDATMGPILRALDYDAEQLEPWVRSRGIASTIEIAEHLQAARTRTGRVIRRSKLIFAGYGVNRCKLWRMPDVCWYCGR